MFDKAKSSPILRFDDKLFKKDDDIEKVRDNVSAVVLRGDHLWLGGDEGTAIDRMTRSASGDFEGHVRFELSDRLALAAAPKEEIDIEGLDVDGGYLWLIGSHSAKRKKVETKNTDPENIERLSKVELEGNRFTLARIPLNTSAEPVSAHGTLTAARLKGDANGNVLTAALKNDRHLGRFVPGKSSDGAVQGIPSKDNGFDVEGLAVSGNRVFLGLRGPVLRGRAVVIELRIKDGASGVLALEPIGPAGEPYVKHFLELGGLGVREISIHENDLLILAGPSMDLDGPVFIYRWKDALDVKGESLTSRKDLSRVVAVPFAQGLKRPKGQETAEGKDTPEGHDHAEGLSVVTHSPLSVLVSYDSPHSSRFDGRSGVKADVFEVAL
jgi:Protein of unknown function (DUF3616)